MPLIVALFLLLQFIGNWYLSDRIGSVTGITDNTGALINSTTYDSYGHILSQTNPAVADQLAFTGREFDSETGLYYFRARYFNPDLGRFQSEDFAGFQTGDFNVGRYVRNSPLNYRDPTGLEDTEEDALILKRLRRTDSLSRRGYSKLVIKIEEEGLQDPVIKYVKIDDDYYAVFGSNRLRAARQLGITDQLILEEVSLPFAGYKTAADVFEGFIEIAGGF
jgi:RHS repeat-associated protein